MQVKTDQAKKLNMCILIKHFFMEYIVVLHANSKKNACLDQAMIILFEINQKLSTQSKQDLSGSFQVSCKKYCANITQILSACMLSVLVNNTQDIHI